MSPSSDSEPTNAATKALAGRRIGEMSASEYLEAVTLAKAATKGSKRDKRNERRSGRFPLRPRLSD